MGKDPVHQTLRDGFGPVFQRDYWAPIRAARLAPEAVIELVAGRFPEFAPESLCHFGDDGAKGRAWDLRQGTVVDIRIRATARCQVQVVQRDALSFTLATLVGHPEAGKITFGAYRNADSEVVFHIRSRARARSLGVYLGFMVLGEAMQTNTWADFVDRVALSVGEGPISVVHAETRLIRGDEAARIEHQKIDVPTFLARPSTELKHA